MALNPETLRNELVWRWRHFAVFSGPEWHRVLSLRTEIFVVEQTCPYQEVDDKDPLCWHLELTHQGALIGTLRVSPPGWPTTSAPSAGLLFATIIGASGWAGT